MGLKRSLLLVLVVACILSIAAQVSFAGCGCAKAAPCAKGDPCSMTASPGACNDNAWKKLGRGFSNILTSPMEMPNQISIANRCDGPFAAFTYGVIKGVGMTAFRALVGVYEVVTFPVPSPEGYKPILTNPVYFFEDQIC